MHYSDNGKLLMAIRKYSSKEDAILEIGCRDGFFLDRLVKQGYKQVYGIDLEQPARGKIKKGDARDLAAVFGNRKFRLVYAQDVFGFYAQTSTMFSPADFFTIAYTVQQAMIADIKRGGQAVDDLQTFIKNAECGILRSAYAQIDAPGYMIVAEDGLDRLVFDEQNAVNAGFEVVSFEPKFAILRKPIGAQQ